MSIDNFFHTEALYALALQFGDHRAAAHFALRRYREEQWSTLWLLRLRGSLARRFR